MTSHLAVPDVIIGGAPRSGTMFLCEVLAKHPVMYVARPFIPEPKVCMTEHPDGPLGLLQRYAGFFADAPPGTVRVEKTSYYLENAEARERLVGLLPEAKYVFILREPVARAYSNWSRSTKMGLETLSFPDAIAREGKRSSPLPPELGYARPFDYITRGRYGSFAEAWLEAVGRERAKFFILEAFLADRDGTVRTLQEYLGVEQRPWDELFTGKVNATEPGREGLDPSLVAILRRRIAPEVRKFAEVTGVDVSIWKY